MHYALLLLGVLTAAPDRVTDVRTRRMGDVRALVQKAGLHWPVEAMYVRVFKRERQVEVWARDATGPMQLVSTFDICAASGTEGPKRREGDLQVPEGFYELVQFNATSAYHLSLKVDYPNASDRVRSDREHPGNLIYLHGSCASIGCIAIENEPIEVVYLLALDAKQRRLPIHLYPFRLTPENLEAVKDAPLAGFWRELAPGYQQFEATHQVPRVTVDRVTGAYQVAPLSAGAAGRSR